MGTSSAAVSRSAVRILRWLCAWILFGLSVAMLQPVMDSALSRLYRDIANRYGTADAARAVPSTSDPSQPAMAGVDCAASDVESSAQNVALSRNLVVDLRASRRTVSVQVDFDPCSSAFAQIKEQFWPVVEAWNDRSYELMHSLVGSIRLDDLGFAFRPPQLHIDGSAQAASANAVRILANGRLESSYAPADRDKQAMTLVWNRGAFPAAQTNLVIHTDPSTSVWSRSVMPTSQVDGKTQYLLLPERLDTIEILVSTASRTAAPREHRSDSDKPPALIGILEDRVREFAPAWLWLKYALPFAVLLLWSRRTLAPYSDVALSTASHCGLALFLITGLASVELIEVLADLFARFRPSDPALMNAGWAVGLIQCAFVAFVWPMTARSWRDRAPAAPASARIILLALSIGILLGSALWMIYRQEEEHILFELAEFATLAAPRDERWLGKLQLLALISASFVLSSVWLGIEIGQERRRWIAAATLFFGVLAVLVLDALNNHRSQIAMAAVLAVPFGWTFAKATVRWISSVWHAVTAVPMLLFASLGAVLAIVLTMPPAYIDNPSVAWLVTSCAWAAVRLWQLVGIAALLAWFQQQSPAADDGDLTREMRYAALAFTVVMFYWRPQEAIVPLLIVFAIGLYFQWQWLLAPLSFQHARRIRARTLGRAIARAGRAHQLAAIGRSLRKSLAAKAGSSELTAREYLEKTDALHRLIAERRHVDMHARGRLLLALNRGALATPWQRGVRGAWLALILSIPWITSYFWNLARAPDPTTNADVISQLGSVLLEVGRWPALGFLFLYFYPRIRGRNGIQKGMALTVAVVAPLLAGTIAWSASSADAWLKLLFWSLQAFICCMTIGVGLGDLAVLKRAGKGPRSLLEVYDLGTLAAWSSSLAIAIGAAITTALATQAGSLFVSGLKLLLPEKP